MNITLNITFISSQFYAIIMYNNKIYRDLKSRHSNHNLILWLECLLRLVNDKSCGWIVTEFTVWIVCFLPFKTHILECEFSVYGRGLVRQS